MKGKHYSRRYHIERGVLGFEVYSKRNGYEPITHKQNLCGVFKSKRSAQLFIDHDVQDLRDFLKSKHPVVAYIHVKDMIHENIIP